MKSYLLLLSTFIFVYSCTQEKIQYPDTQKEIVNDDYFGIQVEDPYRWLEDDNSEETAEWVKAQNEITFAYLEKLPNRKEINKRLTELWNYPKYSTPFKRAGKYYFFKNDGLQNQSVLYMVENLEDEPVVAFDPNKLSDDGTVALTGITLSEDGKYMVYMIASSGSDWKEIFVKDMETGELLDDHIKWVKFSGLSWYNGGFYYSGYDEPGKGSELSAVNEYHKIYYHKVGTVQANDKLVYEDKQYAQRNYYAETTEDKRFLNIYLNEASSGDALSVMDLKEKSGKLIPVVTGFENEFYIVGNVDDELFAVTNIEAPKNRLVKFNINKPGKENWIELIPEKGDVLESVDFIGGKMVATYLKDVHSVVEVYSYNGSFEYKIEIPGIGTIQGFNGKQNENIAFYGYSSFNTPTEIHKFDFETGESTLHYRPDVKFNPDEFEVKQEFFKSKDGTKVPMFIVHKKGIKLNGNNPTLLYAYGGFNISITPSFSPREVVFIENGGIYAVANIRGGGEYGEEWHIAGTKMQKQNVFDDFIGAAEYLIEKKYTSNKKLAVLGESNGGLLVGAVINQRPDLFKVAFPMVGVMDMLRYHKFTIGWAWAADFGTSEDSKEMFNYLYNYSPYHTIIKGGKYPAVMVGTADHDDRVVPAHSFKYISRLQEYNAGNLPVLVRIDVKAGHGGGKPTEKRINEFSDMWAFMFYHLGIKVSDSQELD